MADAETVKGLTEGFLREIGTFGGGAGGLKKNVPLQVTGEQISSLGTTLKLPQDATLLALADSVASLAVEVAISHFKVGACALGASGTAYFGCNCEHLGASLHDSVHGEQTAIQNATLNGDVVVRIAVNATPCGYCRQYMAEMESAKGLEVVLHKENRPDYAEADIECIPLFAEGEGRCLLPMAFKPADLGLPNGFRPMQHWKLGQQVVPFPWSPLPSGVQLSAEVDDFSGRVAELATRSWAPYTRLPCAVGLLFAPSGEEGKGEEVLSMYIENAAFNPSQAPIPVAFSLAALAGIDLSLLRRAVLVQGGGVAAGGGNSAPESPGANYVPAAAALLAARTGGKVPLEVVLLEEVPL